MVMYIVGHKNPDTDSVCAAIAMAELKNKMGGEAKAIIQGEINPETEFVLKKFDVDVPEIMTDGAEKDIFLVDHSDIAQTIDNLEPERLLGIVDHHKLGDVTSTNPLEIFVMPVGCTCTVIKHLFDSHEIEIPQKIAALMLSAIVSDTVIFKSATTTEMDEKAVEDLAKIARIDDVEDYGMEMFKAKSAIEGCTSEELLTRDYKDFDMSGNKVGVGQLEVVDISMFDEIKGKLFEAMQAKKEEGRHSVFLLLTDIMKEGSEMLIVTDDERVVDKAFGVAIEDNKVWLDDVMSRKKQVVPELEKAFSEL